MLDTWPDWIPKKQMPLGLDLQGGSHILLEVDRQSLVTERVASTRDEVRTKLRDAKVGYTGLANSGRTVQVRIRDAADIEKAKEALASLVAPVSSGTFGTTTLHEVSLDEPEPGLLKYTLTDEGIDYRIGTAVTQSIEVVGKRVNELGTTEPIIQRQGNDRILVQVPGLQDPQRLKEILGKTAKLTFQMVDQSMPVQDALNGRPPAGSSILYSNDDPPVPYLIEDRVIVSGEDLDHRASRRSTSAPASRSCPSASTARARSASARPRRRMSAAASPSSSTSRSSPRRVIREPILGGTRSDFGQFHVAERQRSRGAAARRRAAGDARPSSRSARSGRASVRTSSAPARSRA